MKKVFLTLALLMIVILSCEKEHCWGCTQITIYDIPGYLPDTNVVKSVRCDLTKETVNDMEHWLTYDATECINGTIVNIHSSYHCMEATCWEVK
jgi:hypothetical protein